MMTTKVYVLWEWENKEVRFNRPSEDHKGREIGYWLRDKLLECTTEEVQWVINEILAIKNK